MDYCGLSCSLWILGHCWGSEHKQKRLESWSQRDQTWSSVLSGLLVSPILIWAQLLSSGFVLAVSWW